MGFIARLTSSLPSFHHNLLRLGFCKAIIVLEAGALPSVNMGGSFLVRKQAEIELYLLSA